MSNLEFLQVAATMLIVTCIISLGVFAYIKHDMTHRKLDNIRDEAKGVRIRLERHAEESADERRSMYDETKRQRSQIYKMFAEFLAYMKGK